MCVLSHCVQLFATPWTIVHQAPLSMEFSRQEYWSGLSFPPPGDLPDPGIKPLSPASPALAGGFFITVSPGKPRWLFSQHRTSTVIPNIFIKSQRLRLHAMPLTFLSNNLILPGVLVLGGRGSLSGK